MISQFKLSDLAVGDPTLAVHLSQVGMGPNNMLQYVFSISLPTLLMHLVQVVCSERKADNCELKQVLDMFVLC